MRPASTGRGKRGLLLLAAPFGLLGASLSPSSPPALRPTQAKVLVQAEEVTGEGWALHKLAEGILFLFRMGISCWG